MSEGYPFRSPSMMTATAGPIREIIPVADTVVVRADPQVANA